MYETSRRVADAQKHRRRLMMYESIGKKLKGDEFPRKVQEDALKQPQRRRKDT
jgi:hypothetical protein